jgi:hypothetical protein
MAVRSTVSQGVQIRKETTYGTDPGSGQKKLNSLSIDISWADDSPDPFRPAGNKYPTSATRGKVWGVSDVNGVGDYNENIYPWAMIGNQAVSTSITVGITAGPVTGVLAREWIFGSNVASNDVITSFSVFQGDANIAEAANGHFLTDIGFDVDRTHVQITGRGMARKPLTGQTMPASPTAITTKLILPEHFSVYKDTTAAGLGTTNLTDFFHFTFNLGGKLGADWPLDSSLTSFKDLIELVPNTGAEVQLMADAAGTTALDTAWSNDAALFFRFLAISPTIIETITAKDVHYAMQLDCCFKITGAPTKNDLDGVQTWTWPVALFADPTWGKAWECRLVNTVTAL